MLAIVKIRLAIAEELVRGRGRGRGESVLELHPDKYDVTPRLLNQSLSAHSLAP